MSIKIKLTPRSSVALQIWLALGEGHEAGCEESLNLSTVHPLFVPYTLSVVILEQSAG